jgi:Domain of unknown function (DUF4132)
MGGAELEQAEPDWAGHEARAGHLADVSRWHDWVRSGQDAAAMRAWTESVHGAPPDVAASLLLLLIRRASAHARGPDGPDLTWGLKEVRGRPLVVSAADAAWAVRKAAAMPGGYGSQGVIEAAAALAVRCGRPVDRGLLEAVEVLGVAVDAHSGMLARDRTRIRNKLRSLRSQAPAGESLDTTMIRPGDGWSAAVLEQAARWRGDPGGANLLLRHLAAAAGSKPSRKWQDRAVALLADPGAEEVLRILVESAATAKAIIVRRYDWELPHLVSEPNADLLRAACWAAGALAADWAVPALHATGGRSAWGSSLAANGYVASAKIPNACVYGLGLIGSEPAIASLLDLQRKVKHAGFHKQVGAALAVAAARAGLSLGELAERLVPDAGLDGQGERQVAADGTVVASVSIGDGWRVRTEWRETTDRSAQIPDDTARQVRSAAKEVKAALAGERRRLEGLLAEERSWAVADWRRRYLGHPVTGTVARGLIWSFSTGEVGIPADDGLIDGTGGRLPIPSEAMVRLWHPARAGTAQVGRWRDYLVAAGRVQPFKQAFREVYLITQAELETRLYSNRFAAHVLRYRQAYALFKERGWAANYLGPYDGGYEGQARRDFPDAGLTAFFDHFPVEGGTFAYPVGLCTTDRVGFVRTGDRRRTRVPLAEVPELVFSEAMRDVDLFVSVASIALDPQWADRGEDPHFAYWREHAFGDLTQTAVVRGEALARLVPKLKIAPRLELDGRYLRVQGTLNAYKIHIGSGNVLIEPDDRYLCIVPASGRAKVMLPFDGDQVLSIVLSKAVLLAADDKITDPAITSQLKDR